MWMFNLIIGLIYCITMNGNRELAGMDGGNAIVVEYAVDRRAKGLEANAAVH